MGNGAQARLGAFRGRKEGRIAVRVITLARKPLSGSVADNVAKHDTGGLNIEASRVQTRDNLDGGAYAKNPTPRAGKDIWSQDRKGDTNVFKRGGAGDYEQPSGRWPSNVILEHRPECECVGTKAIKGITGTAAGKMAGKQEKSTVYEGGWGLKGPTAIANEQCGFVDDEGNEVVEDWECAEDCPVAALDDQSGILKSGAMDSIAKADQYTTYGKMYERRVVNPASEGGASRFFKQVKG